MLSICSTNSHAPADTNSAEPPTSFGLALPGLGREAKQGEVGLVVGNEYFAIRDFEEE